MPSGSNPNSKKALAENRKRTQFSGENAVKMGAKGNATRKYNASFRAAGKDLLTDEEMQKMWEAIEESTVMLFDVKRMKELIHSSEKLKDIWIDLLESGMRYKMYREGAQDITSKDAEVNIAFLAPVAPAEKPPENIEVESDE